MSLLDGQLPPQMDFNQDAGGLQARRILDAILAREKNTRAERPSA